MARAVTKTGRILLVVGRIALGAIFIYAAWGKLQPAMPGPISPGSIRLSLSLFALQIDSYQLLSPNAVNFVAHTLPFFELALGLLLLSGVLLRWVSILTSALMLGFFGVMIRTYALGLEINCGCFGREAEALGAKRVIIEGLFVALSLAVTFGAFWARRSRSQPSAEAPSAIQLNPPQPQKAD